MIPYLDELLLERKDQVQEWFNGHLKRVRMPVYTSVDLRNAWYKISPIDTNLYPSGFNNLCNSSDNDCVISFRRHLRAAYGEVARILIIAEVHTRNPYYIENLKSIIKTLEKDGYEARAGLMSADLWRDAIELNGLTGKLTLGRIFREGDRLRTADFVPEIIISNNDFSEGTPDMIKGVSQPIDPPPELGWTIRRKHRHFEILHRLTRELAEILQLTAWSIFPITRVVQDVDFPTMQGLDRIADTISKVLGEIGANHLEYDVSDKPFVFIKSNYGTYGHAIMTASSAGEFLEKINKKEKRNMQRSKGGMVVRSVIVQEGVPTADLSGGCPAEPVIYLIGGEPVGGFYRINCRKTIRGNLNSPGMTFSKICFHKTENRRPAEIETATYTDAALIRVMGVMARVAAIAAAYEREGMP